MFFCIVLTPISTTSGLWSTGNTRKYHQIYVYIYQYERDAEMCNNAPTAKTRCHQYVKKLFFYILEA